jgi:hypothetical protein
MGELEDERGEEFACVEGVLNIFGLEICWREFRERLWVTLGV